MVLDLHKLQSTSEKGEGLVNCTQKHSYLTSAGQDLAQKLAATLPASGGQGSCQSTGWSSPEEVSHSLG